MCGIIDIFAGERANKINQRMKNASTIWPTEIVICSEETEGVLEGFIQVKGIMVIFRTILELQRNSGTRVTRSFRDGVFV